jgi:RNA polymerase sigma factor (sigma-70 family)
MVSLLKKRDMNAFGVLYDNYSAALYGVIFRIVNSEEVAQDLLQEAFVKIWKNAESYDAAKGRLFTWMLNIARNTAIDATRSKQFRQDAKIQSIDNSVGTVNRQSKVFTPVNHIGVKEVLGKLKEEHRIIIDMLYFGGYTQDEVAKELNMPLGTVKTRSRAAIQQLRELLNVKQL